MKRTATLVTALAGVVVVVLFIFPGPMRPGAGRTGQGPLTAGDPTVVGTPHDDGDTLTFGHVAVFNTGRRTAVLDAVSFDPPLPANLALLGIQVAPDPHREIHTIGEMEGYPPVGLDVGRLSPLKGAKVHPQTSVQGKRGVPLIMGFRFEGGRLASFHHVIVDYHIGDRSYRARFDKTLIVCSAAAYPDGCPRKQEVYPAD